MKEKDFQTLWHKYLDTHPPLVPEVYELKLTKTGTFAFDSVKEHQIRGLTMAQKGLFHKIADSPVSWSMSKTRFSMPKPFDCMWFTGITAYVVICFYSPRQYKKVFKIGIDPFLKLVLNHSRKSIRLTELEAIIKPINL